MSNCPNCGAILKPYDIGTLSCDYCGSFIGKGIIDFNKFDSAIKIDINVPDYYISRFLTQNQIRNFIQYEPIRDEKGRLHRRLAYDNPTDDKRKY